MNPEPPSPLSQTLCSKIMCYWLPDLRGTPGHPQVLVAITTTFTRQFICLLLLINVNSELTHKILSIMAVICTISPITGADK